jgi:hypothetical protein
MSLVFTHTMLSQRVHFGTGRAAAVLREEVTELCARRVMLVAGGRSTRLGERLTRGLPVVLVWAEVAQHVPAETAA